MTSTVRGNVPPSHTHAAVTRMRSSRTDEFQRDHRAAVQGVGVLGAVCVGLVERVQGAEMRQSSHAERTGKVLVGEQWRGVDTRHGAARDEVGNDCDGVVAVADCAGDSVPGRVAPG